MEAVVDGGNGDGGFAATINANDNMVASESIATAQLRAMTAIAAATIGQRCHHHRCNASSSLHPTAASVHDDCHQQKPPSLQPPSTAASIINDCHCHCQRQTTTAGFWQLSSLTGRLTSQWRLLMVAIAVIVDSGGS
jgi:hypothetical protein